MIRTMTSIILISSALSGASQPSQIPTDFFGINGWQNYKIGDATNVYNCYGLSSGFPEAGDEPCFLYGKFDEYIMSTCPAKITSLSRELFLHSSEYKPRIFKRQSHVLDTCLPAGREFRRKSEINRTDRAQCQ